MLDDSVIIVPNGKLADMPIINRGAKRRQILAGTLLVTSGGSREKLEALTEDIRSRLLADPGPLALFPGAAWIRNGGSNLTEIDTQRNQWLARRDG